MTIEKPQRYKSAGINQMPAERIEAGGRRLRFEIHELINSIFNTQKIALAAVGIYNCSPL
jgi:hypothetical protein